MSYALRVFDPPQCCATGVCGPDVDPTLVQFAADLHWLTTQGVEVSRFNLAQQPDAFVREPVVREAVNASGTGVLPLVVSGGRIVAHSRYPNRAELARIAGLTTEDAPFVGLAVVAGLTTGSCCGPNGGGTSDDCC
jgi:hypothetical protein